jgi:exopolyphosphatase/guanosine-5'-triphosphate,3'-diphosphate pyrophosphatase
VRVAVVDIGTNSTRLLVADVRDGRIGDAPMERVFAVLDDYARIIDDKGCDARIAVMTSAVRDAANGRGFAETVRERYGLDVRTLSGDEEARLTFLGATAGRDPDDPTPRVLIDIGGGSTELVIGAGRRVEFHVSMQAGVVRHTERYLATDPPRPEELEALADDVRAVLEQAVPDGVRAIPEAAIAVGGTATQAAAISLSLETYDRALVEGHALTVTRLSEMLSCLAAKPLAERREVTGLDPARAPTIVAGIAILITVLRFLDLGATEISEHDILWGVALDAAA